MIGAVSYINIALTIHIYTGYISELASAGAAPVTTDSSKIGAVAVKDLDTIVPVIAHINTALSVYGYIFG